MKEKMIRKTLKKMIRKALFDIIVELKKEFKNDMANYTNHAINAIKNNIKDEKEGQIILKLKYKELLNNNQKLPSFNEVGFRKYSQFKEDGILLFLFSVLGVTNKVVIDIGSGNGINSNSANLIINHGWNGLLIDGDIDNIERGREFFNKHCDTFLFPPKLICDWITAENIDNLIKNAGYEGEIDLLSIDIDGNDYWVFKAIECVKPRVIICETSNFIPHDKALTIPYKASFCYEKPDYHGASLLAMAKLAQSKGYRLVGTNRFGFNAFFIRNDIGQSLFPEVSVKSCLQDPYSKKAVSERWAKVKDLEWIGV